jgi:holo-[acyl-carrier protein] synthase
MTGPPDVLRIGLDVVDVARFRRFVDRHAGRLDRLFSARERRRCEAGGKRVERYACRFAAKESLLKALGTVDLLDMDGPYRWTDVEILTDGLGRPRLELSGALREAVEAAGVEHLAVSMSHTRTTAVAQVVLLARSAREGREHGIG